VCELQEGRKPMVAALRTIYTAPAADAASVHGRLRKIL
jgi:hypothetical protein